MRPRIHVFAVAVVHYEHTEFSTAHFAENDCRKFVEALQALGAEPVNCVKLLGSDATKPAIEVALKHFIKGIDSRDTLVFLLAGNSVSFNELNHLVSHDTQLNDIQKTSFQLGTVLKEIGERNNCKALIFIHPKLCAHLTDSIVGTNTTSFSEKELRGFCEDAENRIAFISCKDGESSWPNQSL